MADFLDRARSLFADNPHNECSADLQRVFTAISKLQSVHSKSELDIVNLESVFSAFEMAELLGIEHYGRDLVRSMRRLIAWTLDEAVRLTLRRGKIFSSSPYESFASLISKLTNGRDPTRSPACSVITFNYDLALDAALHSAGLNPNYGLTDDSSGAVNLFKLHGSASWHRCSDDSCKKVVPDTLPTLGSFSDTAEMKWSELKPLLGRQAYCHGKPPAGDSVIVPPSWNKAEYRSDLASVWRRAAAELRSATSIIVCGYSLPETDSFFRYLYGLGTVGGEPLERFWVLDPSVEVDQRFRSLLGPGARARFKADHYTFEQALPLMHATLL